MKTDAELKKMFDSWASDRGIPISKGDAAGTLTLDNTNFGDLLPREAVRDLIDLTQDQSQFLQMIKIDPVSSEKGTVPFVDWTRPTLRKLAENQPLTKGTGPDTGRFPYRTQRMGAIISYTLRDLREAEAAGIDQWESKMNTLFAQQVANDLCRIIWDGDSSLDESTNDLNAMLAAFDGIHKLAAQAHVIDASTIAAYGLGVHNVMLDKMPAPYNADAGLKWLMSRRTDSAYHRELEKLGTALGDAAKVTGQTFSPFGIPKSVVPQLRDDLGVSGTPDGVTDDADGTITLQVDTLLGGAAAGNAGRTIKVTYTPSGLSEVLKATWDGSNNFIATTTNLGQTTISTTATDYTIETADETSIVLCNPDYIHLVMLDQWRASRMWNEEYERWEIRIRMEGTLVLPITRAIVITKRLTVPIVNTWSAAA